LRALGGILVTGLRRAEDAFRDLARLTADLFPRRPELAAQAPQLTGGHAEILIGAHRPRAPFSLRAARGRLRPRTTVPLPSTTSLDAAERGPVPVMRATMGDGDGGRLSAERALVGAHPFGGAVGVAVELPGGVVAVVLDHGDVVGEAVAVEVGPDLHGLEAVRGLGVEQAVAVDVLGGTGELDGAEIVEGCGGVDGGQFQSPEFAGRDLGSSSHADPCEAAPAARALDDPSILSSPRPRVSPGPTAAGRGAVPVLSAAESAARAPDTAGTAGPAADRTARKPAGRCSGSSRNIRRCRRRRPRSSDRRSG